MRKLIIIIVSFIVSIPVFSQYSQIKINGLILGATYTDSQLIDSLGAPSRILPIDPDFPDWVEYRYLRNTTGNESAFLFIDGSLQKFCIRDTTFKLNNYLEVGMDIAMVNQMGGVIFNLASDLFYWAPSEEYKSIGYAIIHFNPSNQKITLIDVSTKSDFI